MDFTHDEEQVALRDAVRALLGKKYGDFEERRRVVRGDLGFDEATWQQLAEMGVLGLPFAEDDGGMGAGPVEFGLVASELGRVLAPEPFLASVVLGGGAVAAAGTAEQRAELLGALASGEQRLALAHTDGATPVTAAQADGGWALTGVKEPVLSGDADRLVVSATLPGDGGTGLFLVDGDACERTTGPAFDGSRVSRVVLDGTPATPLGEPGADASAHLRTALDLGRLAACHEALGGMEVALEATTAYLKSRKQFGVPLNTFQALNFRAADLYVSLELTRSIVAWATMMVAESEPELAHEAVTRAALQTSRAGRHLGQESIQLHGGIAMTAEYLVGNITSHLTALDHLLGDGQQHLTELASGVDAYPGLDPLAPTMRSASTR
jgi:alkylation response protein AidB-like acyl-CoA dehydrogenase